MLGVRYLSMDDMAQIIGSLAVDILDEEIEGV